MRDDNSNVACWPMADTPNIDYRGRFWGETRRGSVRQLR